jgi:hypothetical protein
VADQVDLILGAAQGMNWDALRPFVESLRQTGFSGEVRLFVSDMPTETIERLRSHDVVVQPVRQARLQLRRGRFVLHPYNPRLAALQPSYPRLLTAVAGPDVRRRARLAAPFSIAHVARYLRALELLESERGRYRNVMLTDTRDVFFQRSPFDFDVGDDVHCFLEEAGLVLGTETNAQWLRLAYGDAVARELADQPISCSGVTIGSAAAVRGYLAVMADELTRLPRQIWGIDQGVHNYVVHRGLVSSLRVVPNREGPVATVGAMTDVTAATVTDGDGRPIHVVHQYDCHPALVRLLLDRLSASSALAS